MARGPRKTIEEKIAAKQEIIDALLVRVDAEKEELAQLQQEKRLKELEAVGDLIEEAGLAPDEVAEILQQYLEGRDREAS